MMDGLIQTLRWTHMALGFVGLTAWWVPILAKKGGKRHVAFGKVFAVCAYAVGGTAMLTPPRFASALNWLQEPLLPTIPPASGS